MPRTRKTAKAKPRSKHPNAFSPTEIKRKQTALVKIFKPFYKSNADRVRVAKYFMAAHFSPEKVEARLERMKIAGVPLVGLQWKISRGKEKFNELIWRYERATGLTKRQIDMAENLLRKGVSPKALRELFKNGPRTAFKWADFQLKFKYFESFNLDPTVFGIRKLRVEHYEHILGMRLGDIKTSVKKYVLNDLEDVQAARQLDKISRLNGWRDSPSLNGKNQRPATTLKRYNAARKARIKPTFYLLTSFSAKTIEEGKARVNSEVNKKKTRAA